MAHTSPMSNPPIKINTSMTTMAITPKHNITPSSCSSSSSKSRSNKSYSPRTPYFPGSPVSPITPYTSNCGLDTESETIDAPETTIENEMIKRGYTPIKELTNTLQGSIWKATKSNKEFVVKVTKKSLHEKKIAIVNETEVAIQEDIIKETAILRYLSSQNSHKNVVNFESFFSDKNNFFLVMEDGGTGFFEFVSKCHQFINSGKLTIEEWQRFAQMAFKQIVGLIDWLHNTMNACHLDISLENFVISNVMVTINDKQIKFSNDFTIKIIDFGLAEVFYAKNIRGKISFYCSKYVGKTAYKAPAVYARKRQFDARAADIWSLGVVLFMMIVGGSPYQKPCKDDISFRHIVSGKITKLLKEWKREHFMTPCIVDLLTRIFKREKYRLNINEIKRHPWLL